jgi:hypothetical protein
MGLLPWALAIALSVGIGGGGHGWVAPFFVSIPLLALYPLAFIAAFSRPRSTRLVWALLLAALLLNLFLLALTVLHEPGYFAASVRFAAGPVALWIALWLAWQVLAVMTLLRTDYGNS